MLLNEFNNIYFIGQSFIFCIRMIDSFHLFLSEYWGETIFMLAAKVIFEILERLLEVKNIEKEKNQQKKIKEFQWLSLNYFFMIPDFLIFYGWAPMLNIFINKKMDFLKGQKSWLALSF